MNPIETIAVVLTSFDHHTLAWVQRRNGTKHYIGPPTAGISNASQKRLLTAMIDAVDNHDARQHATDNAIAVFIR